MLQAGDHVIYKNNGVCRIEKIGPIDFGTAPRRDYYVLHPVAGDGTFYVPVENEGGFRKIPSREEIDRLIQQTENSRLKWIENSKVRIAAFDRMLASEDREAILWIVKMLSQKKEEEQAKNKKLCSNEERILATAERIITDEFSYALELPKAEVIPYILKQIEESEA